MATDFHAWSNDGRINDRDERLWVSVPGGVFLGDHFLFNDQEAAASTTILPTAQSGVPSHFNFGAQNGSYRPKTPFL
ncbi:MAG: hypothetical protein ISS66_04760 [Desulfobacteraceae bacterium]|nr:hypothetical protein [Desulfobacteraceae bacterium]